MSRKLKLTVDDFFKLIGEDTLAQTGELIKDESINVDRFKVYKDSWRYRTFYQKGCTCVACGRKGTKFILNPDSKNPERAHFNLYSDDNVLMTKDHILPVALGGEDSIDNFQTMCAPCNEAKGCKVPADIKVPEISEASEKFAWRVTEKDTGIVREFLTKEDVVLKIAKIKLSSSWKDKRKVIKVITRLTTLLDNGGGNYLGFSFEKK